MSDSALSKIEPNQERQGLAGGLEDFLQSTGYNGLQRPIDGTEQFINHATSLNLPHLSIIEAPQDHNWETIAGKVVGTIGDVMLTAMALRSGMQSAGLNPALADLPVWESGAIRGATLGATFSLMSPVADDNNYWANKGKAMALSTAGFAVMGAIAKPLSESLGGSIPAKVGSRLTGGVASGATRMIMRTMFEARSPALSDLRMLIPGSQLLQ